MSEILKFTIIAMHFSIYIAASVVIWIFHQRLDYYTHVVRLRSMPLIYIGLACLMISTSFEIAEHAVDSWIYMSHISFANNMFFTFLNMGMILIALGLRKSTVTDILAPGIVVAIPIFYLVLANKPLVIVVMSISTIIFVYHWYVVMGDWLVFLFPILSSGINLFFGYLLVTTGQQVFHAFVAGPSAISLLILGYVAWANPIRRPQIVTES